MSFRLKQKFVLLLVAGFVVVGITGCCTDDTPEPTWNPPQPIDSLLLGSWQSEDIAVTFLEDNECFIKYKGDYSNYREIKKNHNWYVRGDILIFPGDFDSRTKRFPEYRYKLENKELYFEGISHPFVGCGPWTMEEYVMPLWINRGFLKKVEE